MTSELVPHGVNSIDLLAETLGKDYEEFVDQNGGVVKVNQELERESQTETGSFAYGCCLSQISGGGQVVLRGKGHRDCGDRICPHAPHGYQRYSHSYPECQARLHLRYPDA